MISIIIFNYIIIELPKQKKIYFLFFSIIIKFTNILYFILPYFDSLFNVTCTIMT